MWIEFSVSVLKRRFVTWGKRRFDEAASGFVTDIVALTEYNPDAIALDCGCGNGANTLLMIKRIKPREIWGIEADQNVAQEAERKGIRVFVANMNSIFPLGDRAVDAVLSNQVIEHLPDTDRFMTEIWRVLKPGGYAIICTENLASWHNIGALIFGWQPFSLTNISNKAAGLGNPLALHHLEDPTGSSWNQHMRILAHDGLIDLSKVHGFKVETVRGAGYYPLSRRPAKYMAAIDPRHTAFLTLKIRKPA